MTSKEDITKGVNDFFEGDYEIVDGRGVPNVEDLQLRKHGKQVELAMLFIDIRESTKIVDGFRRTTAAKMYKSFLWGVTQIARANSGDVRSFNGDGVLVAFYGESKRTNAARAALQMSWFARFVLKPKLEEYFKNNQQLADVNFDFGIGIDNGTILVVRGGIRGDNNNDLVWVGNATNFAVKLSNLPDEGYYVFISEDVYKNMAESSRMGGDPKREMWERRSHNGQTVYRSSWHWSL